jgi:hypothetical protein
VRAGRRVSGYGLHLLKNKVDRLKTYRWTTLIKIPSVGSSSTLFQHLYSSMFTINRLGNGRIVPLLLYISSVFINHVLVSYWLVGWSCLYRTSFLTKECSDVILTRAALNGLEVNCNSNPNPNPNPTLTLIFYSPGAALNGLEVNCVGGPCSLSHSTMQAQCKRLAIVVVCSVFFCSVLF